MENGNRIGCSLMEAHSQKALLDWVLNQADEEIRTFDPLLDKETVKLNSRNDKSFKSLG